MLLLKGPIHTDIAVPVTPEFVARFGWLDAYLPVPIDRAGWVVFGWGARDFYTSTGGYRDLSPGPVWRAISGDTAVMRVDLIAPEWTPQDVIVISLGPDQQQRLFEAIAAGFATPVAALDHPGFTSADRFFAGAGRFDAFRTCNVWVGQVLAAAGVDVGRWTPFTWSLP